MRLLVASDSSLILGSDPVQSFFGTLAALELIAKTSSLLVFQRSVRRCLFMFTQHQHLLSIHFLTSTEIVRLMGDDVTKGAVQMRMTESIRPIGRLQARARAAGLNPQHIDLSVNLKTFDG